MIGLIIAFLCSIATNIVQVVINKAKKKGYDKLEIKYNKVIGNNRKLQSAIIKINEIEKDRQKDVEEIKNSPDSRVTDILNDVMRYASKS